MAEDSAWFRTASQLQEAGFVRDGSNWIPVQGLRPQQGALGLSGGNDDRSLPLGEGASGRNRERYVPLYEAKMIHQFDHRWATYQAGDSRDVTRTEKQNGNFEPAPRYWVPEGKPQERLGLGIAARFVV